jgi:hypothetical protein
MKQIAISQFMDYIDRFEDKRIQYVQFLNLNPEKKLEVENTIWKCRRYSEYSKELVKYTNIEHRKDFAKHFINLYKKEKTGITWSDKEIVKKADLINMRIIAQILLSYKMDKQHRKQIMDIYRYIRKLEVDYDK